MSRSIRPVAGIEGLAAYSVPRASAPTDLRLDGNEGALPSPALAAALGGAGPELLREYPSTARLEARLAARLGVVPERVVVTAGGDDAIDRLCRAVVSPGSSVVLPGPSFEMIARYARLAGGTVLEPRWSGPAWPLAEVLAAVDDRTRLVAMVSPNNPTGAVVSAADVRAVSAAVPHAVVLLDLAYGEFADSDLTAAALELPNVVVLRTFSKAWGLAGLRVGYAAGPAEVVGWLRVAGAPYAVASPSIFMAEAQLALGDGEMRAFVARVRDERAALESALEGLGATVSRSQGNFVFARVPDSVWLRDAMAGLGIAIRAFPGRAGLEDAVRISCPGAPEALARVRSGLETALAPQALLFDLDGVIADVSASYRLAIVAAAASYGVSLGAADIAEAKAAGDANNDWVLTRRLLASRGVEAPLAEVTARFEAAYQGTEAHPGLWRAEGMLVEPALLERLAARLPLGVVTGRPPGDARRFLEAFGLSRLFSVCVCMGDAPAKPNPAPVRLALERLGVARAWMVGDTPDDVRAARAAGVVPLGICAPGEASGAALTAAGAARVLESVSELEELLP